MRRDISTVYHLEHNLEGRGEGAKLGVFEIVIISTTIAVAVVVVVSGIR